MGKSLEFLSPRNCPRPTSLPYRRECRSPTRLAYQDGREVNKGPSATKPSNSHGNRHQELVEAPEEGVGDIADPDVVGEAHEKQEACLQGRDDPDEQLGPEVPADLHETCQEGSPRTWTMTTNWKVFQFTITIWSFN